MRRCIYHINSLLLKLLCVTGRKRDEEKKTRIKRKEKEEVMILQVSNKKKNTS